ncbi:MAG: hypothetical protein SGPRY_008871 [Prymnesium sp.]
MASVIRANKGAVCAEQLYPHLLDARPAKEALALLLPASFELGEEKWGGRGGAKQGLRGGARTEDRAEAGQGRRQERRIWGGWKVRGRGEDAGLSEGMQGIAPLLVDEALLPALAHLDGTPEPTEGGDVIYRFPDLLPTSTIDRSYGRYPRPLVRGAGNVVRAISGPQPGVDFLEEPLLPFMESGDARVVRPAAHLLLSLARSPLPVLTVALANWCGIVLLGAMLGPFLLILRRIAGSGSGGGRTLLLLSTFNWIYASLLINAAAWLVLPSLRAFRLMCTNLAIRRRNKLRERLAACLMSPLGMLTSSNLRRKLEAAASARERGRHSVGQEPLMYSTAKSLLEQSEMHNPTLDKWDDDLQKRTGSSKSTAGGAKKQPTSPRLKLRNIFARLRSKRG